MVHTETPGGYACHCELTSADPSEKQVIARRGKIAWYFAMTWYVVKLDESVVRRICHSNVLAAEVLW